MYYRNAGSSYEVTVSVADAAGRTGTVQCRVEVADGSAAVPACPQPESTE